MSYTLTTNYNLKKIDYDTEENTWGDLINQNWDETDIQLANALNSRVGLIELRLSIPSYAIECDGRTIDKSTNPEYTSLVDYLRGIGATFQGATSDQAIVPDFRGRFARGVNLSGVNSAPSSNIGDYQQDEFQGHYHNKSWTNANPISSSGAGGPLALPAGTGYPGVDVNILAPSTDGTNGIPRVGSETRPKSISIYYCIVFK